MKYYGLIIPTVFPTGVFIQDIKQTRMSDESEGVNTMTITLTNHQKAYFNIKNGKQGSSVEATAQMEQHAKEYIATELTEQKTMLEQAIENGKVAINNSITQANKALQQRISSFATELADLLHASEETLQNKVNEAKNYINNELSVASLEIQDLINTKVTENIVIAKSTLLKEINKKFIEHYQKGYLQMPGMPSPLEDTSMHYSGYSWYEVKYDGNFFRAKGRGAKVFSSKKLTKENIKNGVYIFYADEQKDAIRNIKGDFSGSEIFNSTSLNNFNGAFSLDGFKPPCADGNYDNSGSGKIKFDASKVVPTAEENRPRNLSFIYWVLVKNE